MLVEHEGRAPLVDPDAWVAPTAALCGDGDGDGDGRVVGWSRSSRSRR
jgi:hypothetical protein